MAVHAEELQENAKGKAVHVLHTFGDSLWDMGCKPEPPDSFEMSPVSDTADETGMSGVRAVAMSSSTETERDNDEELTSIAEVKPPQEDLPSETPPQGCHPHPMMPHQG